MSAYIKLDTLEYPRHEGDIALDPQGAKAYAPVQWVDAPTFSLGTQIAYELPPINVGGVWQMAWAVRDLTQEEIDRFNNPPIDDWRTAKLRGVTNGN